jgi:hypothetical protein
MHAWDFSLKPRLLQFETTQIPPFQWKGIRSQEGERREINGRRGEE